MTVTPKQGRTEGFPIRGVGCSKIYRQNQLNNRAFLRMERFTDEINYTIAHFYVWSDTIMELSKRGQTCRTILDAMNLKITDRLSLKTDNYQLCINLPTILKKLGGCYTPHTPPLGTPLPPNHPCPNLMICKKLFMEKGRKVHLS